MFLSFQNSSNFWFVIFPITNFGFIDSKISYQQTGYTVISSDSSSPNGSYGDQGQDANGHNKAGGGGNGASGQFK